MKRQISLLLFLLIACSTTARSEERIQFNRDIRPILAENCFHCHGPDGSHREGELRLDVRDDAVRMLAIIPGDATKSHLMERVLTSDESELMPPPKSNKTLTTKEKETLKRWIEEGALYEGHWAFIPPVVPELPKREPGSTAHPIDVLVQEKLAVHGLKPSPEADRTTLIRRLSLDLTGIPPTQEEIDAFLNDVSPRAYEKVVDRLLGSPRYGERMALQWLDYARYADSNGFQTDSSRQMWQWRDWVIRAFNSNMPFDQFTVEQLAGDLLPSPTTQQFVATGFHRNNRINGEGGRIVEEWFAETVIDRVETTGQTWLALTVGCCRCHDHKYDPISQKEFYQLFAFFNSIDESGVLDGEGGGGKSGNSKPLITLPSEEQSRRMVELQDAVRHAQEIATEAEKELPALQTEWESRISKENSDAPNIWTPLKIASVKSEGKAKFKKLNDDSWLASGKNPDLDTYTVSTTIAAGELTGIRLEVIPDPSLPNQSLGRAFNGNFVLSGIEAEVHSKSLADPVKLNFGKAEADYNQKGYEASSILSKGKGWAVDGNDPEKRLARNVMFLVDQTTKIPEDATLTVRLLHKAIAGHNIGRFRLYATSVAASVAKIDKIGLPETVRSAVATPISDRTAVQTKEIANYFRTNVDNPFSRKQGDLEAAKKKLADFENSLPTSMIMKELPTPRDAFLLRRGEYDKPGEKVSRGIPSVLPPLPDDAPVNRLGLAKWIVSPSNPLTARVWVNRQWEKFFGIGLVKSVDNFGTQAEVPSHPELLDWLATEFVRIGWDMKGIQKQIVMSSTYRQSSKADPLDYKNDVDNKLLARGPRFRLPGEVVRDQALAISGLLVEKVGGPSVRPYMPDGVWDETSKYGDLRGYKHDKNDGLYRRSLYTIWKRTAAPPTMLMFDSPSREFCTVKRSRTNTPLQALALLNEVTFVEAARVLAQRMNDQPNKDLEGKIRWGFRQVTGRYPEQQELDVLVTGYERRVQAYSSDLEAAKKLVAWGESKVVDIQPADLAALTLTANVLLNLDEVVTKE
jgi:hypothetical protein